ncbi:TraR/DksA family transcriptional regulator [Luteipulveratus halotolerans]|uniref:TraR/DksA family transcriptional regulator n=1 Tax=Luteipulveratus halotolerans TaxID=1631356 RepID=UPI000681A9E0|nr:TraR/DksA C4-type zinc finger protein [Luteipulveratus halotolerans]
MTTKPQRETRKKAVKPVAKKAAKDAAPVLKVRGDEDPWTAPELEEVRTQLGEDIERLISEVSDIELEIMGLMQDSGDGAGDDEADAGTKTFEREHEFSVAQNSREMLVQSQRALRAIDDGTYGACENCGNAIGKMRLQAFPRATLCLSCKQQQERH